MIAKTATPVEPSLGEDGKSYPLVLITLLIAGGLYLTWPLLFQGEMLAYRDASYLYFPLFHFVQSEWELGTVPLWNPYCGLGQPLLADGSSSVFYPGKLIFILNVIPFSSRFGLYILVHLLLAGWGIYRCGRVMQVSSQGSSLAAIAYTFSAPLLSQSNNVVYLVGAAWIPWAIAAAWSLRQSGWDLKKSLHLAAVTALMILGGDAQMAYHALLIAGMMMLSRRRQGPTADLGWNRFLWQRRFADLLGLGSIAGATIGLAAIQLFPSSQAIQSSVRNQFELPQSIYEIPTYLSRFDSAGLTGIARGLTAAPWPEHREPHQEVLHHSDRYQFSLPPWSLAETIVPNFGGRSYPAFQRWMDELEIQHEMNRRSWYPSLYLGVVTIALAFCGAKILRPQDERQVIRTCLTWVSMVSLLGAFGIFGLGMIANRLSGEGDVTGDQVGGVYWLMTVILPNYVQFRYPAKLLILAVCCLTLLAGYGYDQLRSVSALRRYLWMSGGLWCFACFVLVLSFAGQSWIIGCMSEIRPDPWMGSFNSHGSLFDLRSGAIQSLIVLPFVALLLSGRLFANVSHGGTFNRDRARASLVSAILAVELLVANSWVMHSVKLHDLGVDLPSMSQHSLQDSALKTPDGDRDGNFRSRQQTARQAFDFNDLSNQDPLEADPLARLVAGQIASGEPKFHLLNRHFRLDSFSSIERSDWAFCVTDARFYSEQVRTRLETASAMVLTGDIAFLPPIDERSVKATFERTKQVFDQWVRNITVIETSDAPQQIEPHERGVRQIESTHIAAIRPGSGQFEFNVQLEKPGWVLVSEQFAAGWKCWSRSTGHPEWTPIEIYRANRVMRAVHLPAGTHQVRMVYWPMTFVIGCMVSSISWLVLIFLVWPLKFPRWLRRRNDPG